VSLLSAITTGDASALPGRRDEAWRYSDLRGLLRAVPEASPPAEVPAGPAPLASVACDFEILIVNGRASADRFVVRPGAPSTLRLRFVSVARNSAHQASLEIEAPEGSDLTVIETYEGEGAGYVSNVDLTFMVGQGARIERIVLLDECANAISISASTIELQPGAQFSQTVVASGARLQRHETHMRHPGGGAQVRLDGLYLLDDRRHFDLTSVLTHAAPGGATRELAKGIVRDHARGVFQGRIVVQEGADQTDARMAHHALLLNDGAEIDAKPELEIYADDVSCAHGNTVGSLDESALFYIRSRGLPEHEARALLMEAFLGEVADRIEHEGARAAVRLWLADRLEALA
jgi:Fe-S cluster assembly protein SufD